MLALLPQYELSYDARVILAEEEEDKQSLAWSLHVEKTRELGASEQVARYSFEEVRYTEYFQAWLDAYYCSRFPRVNNAILVVGKRVHADGTRDLLLHPDTKEITRLVFGYDLVEEHGTLKDFVDKYVDAGISLPLLDDPTHSGEMFWAHKHEIFRGDASLLSEEVALLADAELKRHEAQTQDREIRASEAKARALAAARSLLLDGTEPEAPDYQRIAIPAQVQREVWNRDNARCRQCGSQELLEYDHIIPVSRGGANTVRNVQLLCQLCNRSKGARIGV